MIYENNGNDNEDIIINGGNDIKTMTKSYNARSENLLNGNNWGRENIMEMSCLYHEDENKDKWQRQWQ